MGDEKSHVKIKILMTHDPQRRVGSTPIKDVLIWDLVIILYLYGL